MPPSPADPAAPHAPDPHSPFDAARVAIVGPTGYTGRHLIELLLAHPRAELTYLASHRDRLPDITDEFPRLAGRLDDAVAQCRPIDPAAIARHADVAFLALPHKAAMAHAPALLDAGLTVIDLSADYRLADQTLYETTYDTPHTDPAHLAEAVYGLPELFRAQLPGAKLVANPGCYPTTSALAVAPFLSHALVKADRVIVSAASGVTGAGRSPKPALHYPEANEAFAAYGSIGGHRHQPEIEQSLARVAGHPVPVLFVPHLLPIDQGILATVYLDPATDDVTQAELFEALHDAYDAEPFVRVRGVDDALPNVKHVRDTNFCDITVRLAGPEDRPTVVVFAAIDNMIKGASGQAVQNLNAVLGWDETLGLI
ncbi:MAG: N-acetyl-gamma-glutamyl-phosphate reductase [Planctomycetota bacterium]